MFVCVCLPVCVFECIYAVVCISMCQCVLFVCTSFRYVLFISTYILYHCMFRGFDSSRTLLLRGWNYHVHMEFPGRFESSNLSRDSLSREIGLILVGIVLAGIILDLPVWRLLSSQRRQSGEPWRPGISGWRPGVSRFRKLKSRVWTNIRLVSGP